MSDKNEFIWACNNIIETRRRIKRPTCRINKKYCVRSSVKNLLCGFEINEYELCPTFVKNIKYYFSNDERKEVCLINYIP